MVLITGDDSEANEIAEGIRNNATHKPFIALLRVSDRKLKPSNYNVSTGSLSTRSRVTYILHMYSCGLCNFLAGRQGDAVLPGTDTEAGTQRDHYRRAYP